MRSLQPKNSFLILALTLPMASCVNTSRRAGDSGVKASQVGKNGDFTLRNAKGTVIEGPEADKIPVNWFNMDPVLDQIEGTGVDRVYKQFKVNASRITIVAVIDSGVDINHEDLKGRIWVNEAEKKGKAGVDDDHNGFVDDVNGWNFIGGADGRNIDAEQLEITRELVRLKKIKNPTAKEAADLAKYQKEIDAARTDATETLKKIRASIAAWEGAAAVLKDKLNLVELTLANVEAITSEDAAVLDAKKVLVDFLKADRSVERFKRGEKSFQEQLDCYYNEAFDPRSDIVRDDPNNLEEKGYGNPDVIGPDAEHGTHVAGIIAALRNNGKGINGIASGVRIMVLRVVPNGDERDKDIANAVRYATDKGARVINMSFGKGVSPNKDLVDEAFRYATERNVLIVHSAGNDSKNIDVEDHFPNRIVKKDGRKLPNWLEIGASSFKRDESLVAKFSNFGHKEVDFFAPGHMIRSSTPGNTYEALSGTSMAAPVVSGIAAMVMSQFASLTATQMRDVLLRSNRGQADLIVRKPFDGPDEDQPFFPFSSLSATGGLIDASLAFKRATDLQVR